MKWTGESVVCCVGRDATGPASAEADPEAVHKHLAPQAGGFDGARPGGCTIAAHDPQGLLSAPPPPSSLPTMLPIWPGPEAVHTHLASPTGITDGAGLGGCTTPKVCLCAGEFSFQQQHA